MAKILQVKVSYAPTDQEAIDWAVRDWPNGGMNFPKADIRTPEDFEAMSKLVRPENFKNRVLTTSNLDQHVDYLQKWIDVGFQEITCITSTASRTHSLQPTVSMSSRT
jgi:hypothetical protein